MQVGQPQLLEIGDAPADALQVAGEQIDIAHPAEHLVGLEPVRLRSRGRVEGLQVRRALDPGLRQRRQQLFQVVEEVVLLAVHLEQDAEQAREVILQAGLEFSPFVRAAAAKAAKRCSRRGLSRR